MTGLAEAWTFAARAGQGFVLCLAVAALADLVLALRDRRAGTGTRRAQWRSLMVMGLGRLAADALGLLLVFFLLANEWALVGGALGLLCWRALWVTFATRRLPRRSPCVADQGCVSERASGVTGGQGPGRVTDPVSGRHEEAVT